MLNKKKKGKLTIRSKHRRNSAKNQGPKRKQRQRKKRRGGTPRVRQLRNGVCPLTGCPRRTRGPRRPLRRARHVGRRGLRPRGPGPGRERPGSAAWGPAMRGVRGAHGRARLVLAWTPHGLSPCTDTGTRLTRGVFLVWVPEAVGSRETALCSSKLLTWLELLHVPQQQRPPGNW